MTEVLMPNALRTEENQEVEDRMSVDEINLLAQTLIPQIKKPTLSMSEKNVVNHTQTQVAITNLMRLFFEIMKLVIQERSLERDARVQERLHQIAHMKEVVETYQKQGYWQRFAAIGAGFAGILGGAAPIVGGLFGSEILGGLKRLSSRFNEVKKKEFFDGIGKMMEQSSYFSRSMGEVQSTFSQGHENEYQHKSRLAEQDADECTRTLDELLKEFDQIIRFLQETLQQQHQATNSLYR